MGGLKNLACMASLIALLLVSTGCSSDSKVLYIGGIPDQDTSTLQDRFDGLAQYLTEKTGIEVRYVPSIDYAAVVTAFIHNDLHMAWYGGLTGVQARLAVPDAQAIAQRSLDQSFTSVFIARKELDILSLEELKGLTFTFGSESSTSGHLMPRHFLDQAGIDLYRDLDAVNFSGSHDKTWKLVEAGAFQAGALNANVWQDRVNNGSIDRTKVDVFFKTPPYYDYHWVVRGDLDETFGEGITAKLRGAILNLDAANSDSAKRIMKAFQADGFIPTRNENYGAIESVARNLGLIK